MNSQHLFYIRKVRIQQKSTCPRSLTKASGLTYTKVYHSMRKNISSVKSSATWSAFSRENSIVLIVFGAFGVTTWHQGFHLGYVGGNVYFCILFNHEIFEGKTSIRFYVITCIIGSAVAQW